MPRLPRFGMRMLMSSWSLPSSSGIDTRLRLLDILLSQSPLQRPTERSQIYSFSRNFHTTDNTMSIADRKPYCSLQL
jgi:hypothetical protein